MKAVEHTRQRQCLTSDSFERVCYNIAAVTSGVAISRRNRLQHAVRAGPVEEFARRRAGHGVRQGGAAGGKRGPHPFAIGLQARTGWVSMLILEWLRNAVLPPGSRTYRACIWQLPGDPASRRCLRATAKGGEHRRQCDQPGVAAVDRRALRQL